VRDLASGAVGVEGVALRCLAHPVEEIFFRFTRFREWDASELSLAKYCSLRAAGDRSLIAIPVSARVPSATRRSSYAPTAQSTTRERSRAPASAFPSGRKPRPSTGAGSSPTSTASLSKKSPGCRPGATSRARRGRGGRAAARHLADGDADATLDAMLVSGQLDAVIAAHPPRSFGDGGPIVRLFSDHRAVEEESWRRTGVFPIMHVVVLRAEIHERDPWIAMNLVSAFEEAKRRSVERALDTNAPAFPVPWAPANAARALELFGGLLAVRCRGQPPHARDVPRMGVRAGGVPDAPRGRAALRAADARRVSDLERLSE